MAFTVVTVTAKYLERATGVAASGLVTFQLSGAMADPTDDQLAASIPISVGLDANGEISVGLYATTDPGTQPQGRTYKVIERIDGAPSRTYHIDVPHDAAGATIDLADVVPVDGSTASYVLAASGVSFDPSGLAVVTGDTVQEAIEELDAVSSGAALAAHEADGTGVHGIADTADLETQAGAQAKADAAQAAAEATAAADTDADVATHEAAAVAHAASGVSFDPSGLVVVTGMDVQTAIAELDAAQAADSAAFRQDSEPVFIGARDFVDAQGAPTLGKNPNSAAGLPAWLMDASTVEAIGVYVELPDTNWTTFDVALVWSNAGAGAGDVVLRGDHRLLGDGVNANSFGFTSPTAVTAAAPAQNVEKVTTLASGVATGADKRLSLRIYRLANDAADTLANDAAFLGVRITKAS